MKKLAILASFIGFATIPCRAQSTSDLIEQLLLDVQKLQDMKATLQDMYRGYEILDKGYTQIRDIAHGEFSLHKAFLDGLLVVSPAVRNDYRIAAILDAEYTLVRVYKVASPQTIDELTMVLTDGTLRMSDAQRLKSIDRIYASVTRQLRIARHLHNEASLQQAQEQHAINELKIVKQLYGDP